jgi:alpha-amylase
MDRSGNPTYIIFHNGNGGQTSDLDFKNGGYYNESGAIQGVVTGIEEVRKVMPEGRGNVWYDLRGRRLTGEPTTKGIYIYQGKKILK